MKLLSFKADGAVHVGAATQEGIVDLTRALAVTHPEIGIAHSMLAIIESGIDIDAIGDACLGKLRKDASLAKYLVASPHWLPPIPRPPKILALAVACGDVVADRVAENVVRRLARRDVAAVLADHKR